VFQKVLGRVYGLSGNLGVTIEFIKENIDKPWHWDEYGLSKNPNITIDFIKENIDKPWKWGTGGLSCNPGITIDFIKEFPDKPWDYYNGLSRNHFNYKKKLKEYNENKEKCALSIQKGCWNWLNKIECKDHTYGIRPRIDLTESGLFGDLKHPNHKHITRQI
jgi:hypothetical protein